MPLPIAHSAAGLASYILFRDTKARAPKHSTSIGLAITAIVVANFPDLDFLPGLLIGKPGEFHHGPSHSLPAALLYGALIFLVVQRFFVEVSKKTLFLVCLVASLSHPIFDFLSADTSYPYGVPLFWPFHDAYYISPVEVFADVTRMQTSNRIFLTTMFNSHNLMNVVRETLFSVSLLAAVFSIHDAPSRVKLIMVSLTFLLLFFLGRILLI